MTRTISARYTFVDCFSFFKPEGVISGNCAGFFSPLVKPKDKVFFLKQENGRGKKKLNCLEVSIGNLARGTVDCGAVVGS